MKLTHEELEKKLGDVLTDTEYEVIDAAINEVCGANENLEDRFLSLLTDPNNRMLVRGFVTVGAIFKMALLRHASESELKVHAAVNILEEGKRIIGCRTPEFKPDGEPHCGRPSGKPDLRSSGPMKQEKEINSFV